MRIVGTPIETIRECPTNPREISDIAIDHVASSIEAFGWQQPIVVDKEGEIIVGHVRYRAALKLGEDIVPVLTMDADDETVRAYRIADNRTGEFTGWDVPVLKSELDQISEELQISWSREEVEIMKLLEGNDDEDYEETASSQTRQEPVESTPHNDMIEVIFMVPKAFAKEFKDRCQIILDALE